MRKEREGERECVCGSVCVCIGGVDGVSVCVGVDGVSLCVCVVGVGGFSVCVSVGVYGSVVVMMMMMMMMKMMMIMMMRYVCEDKRRDERKH